MTRPSRRSAVHAAALLLATGWIAGCGYALAGRGNTLPAHIRVIGVPGLVNQSTTPTIDEFINREIREEMSGRGGIRVLPEEGNADAILSGTILNVVLQPTAINDARLVTQVRMVVVANVEFKDRKDNKILWSNARVQAQETYDVSGGVDANDPAALFRQDTNAMQRLAKAFARSIVTQIFEAF
jgi:hypothetical protein